MSLTGIVDRLDRYVCSASRKWWEAGRRRTVQPSAQVFQVISVDIIFSSRYSKKRGFSFLPQGMGWPKAPVSWLAFDALCLASLNK